MLENFKVAEDARITDRNKQKTQTIWMEVRFDFSIKMLIDTAQMFNHYILMVL